MDPFAAELEHRRRHQGRLEGRSRLCLESVEGLGRVCTRGAALLAMLALAACTSTSSDEVRLRVGVAVGERYVAVNQRVDEGGQPDRTRELGAANAVSGFVEVGADLGNDLFACRVTGGRTRHDVPGFANAVAEVDTALALFLIGRRVPLAKWLELRSLFGVGVGYGSIDYGGALGQQDQSDLYGALAASVELGFFEHLFAGAMGWGGLGGHPGDTQSESTSVLIYAGVRF